MPRSDNVREVDRGEARTMLAKCTEFAAAARDAMTVGRWNSAGLNAIHAGIAAADTALVASAGLRSSSQDHGAVVLLLERQVPEFAATQRRQLAGLLKMKNQVAYEQRMLTEVEARQLVDQASRFCHWAQSVVDAHLGL